MATHGSVRATHAEEITPHDTNDLARTAQGLYVGVSGNIRVTLVGDTSAVNLLSVPVGLLTGFQIKRVHSTGTTATDIVALY